MDKRKAGDPFQLKYFHWVIMVDCLVVIGAVMSFGVVGMYAFQMNEVNAKWMLAMIPPMAVAVGVTTDITIRFIRKRMGLLLNGIQAVADGDLDVELEIAYAEEYGIIYENFNRMVRELKGTKEEMQQFTNEFSHEFKTPITSIQGFAQYLIDTGGETESPERLKYLQIIHDESLRLGDLAQNTLLLSKVEACEIITDKEAFSLSEQIKHCAILLLPQIEKKKINLEVEMPEIAYYGNSELLEQVWLNLLSNAIKFTPENGEISIEAIHDGTVVYLSFADSGMGMDAETASHVFEKYYQGSAGRSKGGNGIGLAIVQRIVILCGGRVSVTSAPGSGSVFKVELPVL